MLDPTKLSVHSPICPYQNVLYTDFTKIGSSQGSMELLSEFVDVPLQGGACASFNYRVVSMSLDTDSVLLSFFLKKTVFEDFIFLFFYFTSFN